MPPLNCDAILFDLDGVLIDSTTCIVRHWQQWADQHGLDMAAIRPVFHGRPTIETMQLVAPHLPIEEEARRFAAAEALDSEGVTVIDGAAALLASLPHDGWAIVTSGTRPVATARIKYAGLPLPSVLVTADDVSQGKPSPEPFLVAAAQLGLGPDQCVVVEDSPAGLAAATAAGMPAIAVAFTHPAAELTRAVAIADHLANIRIFENGGYHRLTIQVEQ
jgi:sugar-phosphatase